MAKIAKYNGKVIKVGNKLGLHPSCCCGIKCCPFSFDNVPFTLNTTCNGRSNSFTGTLFGGFGSASTGPGGGGGIESEPPYGDYATAEVSVVCSASEICPEIGPLWGGYFITVFVANVFGACSLYGKIIIQENPDNFMSQSCDNQTPGSANVSLVSCFGGQNSGTLTIG